MLAYKIQNNGDFKDVSVTTGLNENQIGCMRIFSVMIEVEKQTQHTQSFVHIRPCTRTRSFVCVYTMYEIKTLSFYTYTNKPK